MATNSSWTVIFDDKRIINQSVKVNGQPVGYTIDDDAFWSQGKFSNIWAIQFGTSNPSDTVEYRDDTPHSNWEDANLGDISDFTTKWDAAHLAKLQADWDNDNVEGETSDDKIARLGARPTSYSS